LLAEPLYTGAGFEESQLRILTKMTRPGMTVIDVGANVGLYTLSLARAVGPHGRVLSLEPFPPIATLLRENVALNRLPWVTVVEKAASDRVGTTNFFVFPEGSDVYNSLGAKHRVEGVDATMTMQVLTTTLDECAKEAGFTSVNTMKVDVEGSEERVVRGAETLIRNSPDITVLVEAYEPSATQCGCSVRRMFEMLLDWGLNLHRIDSRGGVVAERPSSFEGTYAIFRR
jgi:FkbM family methyltransferase